MKPHLICHMAVSLDGRTLPSRWRPDDRPPSDLYESLHDTFEGDAWIVGRVTGQEFAKGAAYPGQANETFPRETWRATESAGPFGVVIDTHGKIAWGRSDIGGDPIVVALSRSVSDAHLAGLRADGVSYIFAGDETVDLATMLEILNVEFGVERAIVEGGGSINGAFLKAGLIDELSLIVQPAVDGTPGAPALFEAGPAAAGDVIRPISLFGAETQPTGAVWLRYRFGEAPAR